MVDEEWVNHFRLLGFGWKVGNILGGLSLGGSLSSEVVVWITSIVCLDLFGE